MNKKFTLSCLPYIGLVLMLLYANYFAIIQHFIKQRGMFVLLFFIIIISVSGIYFKFKGNIIKLYAPFLCFMIIACIYNRSVYQGEYYATIRICVCICMMVILASSTYWVEKFPGVVIKIGILNALATIFFWVFPSLYERTALLLIGELPEYLRDVLKGYTCGIANHYSENGTFISFCLIALWVLLLKNKTKRYNKWLKVLLFINLFALILTTKRAHLLFSVLTMIAIYFIENPKKLTMRVIRAMVMGVVAIVFLFCMQRKIPAIQETIERLMLIGTDDDTSVGTRFRMWYYAWTWFKNRPILGNGFFYFKYAFAHYDLWGRELPAHNVYLQLLCELGMSGFVIYLFGVISLYVKTFNLFRHNKGHRFSSALLVSLGFQTFILSYQLTGNGLYDMVFVFYSISVAVVGATVLRLRTERKNGVIS